MSRRLLLIALALLCASLGLSACGNKEETVTRGESEAIYVTLGEVQYQVQLSRQLDPYSPGDRDLLKGVAPTDRALAKNEIWFGVWVAAVNGTDGPAEARRRVPHQGHDRQGVRADPARGGQPVRLPPRRHRGGRRVPAAGQRVRAVADDRWLPALPHAAGDARLPPARARVRQHRAAGQGLDDSPRRLVLRVSGVRPAAESPQNGLPALVRRAQPRCRPAARMSWATGAAESPPAPAPTSSTPTAIRGVRPGAAGA